MRYIAFAILLLSTPVFAGGTTASTRVTSALDPDGLVTSDAITTAIATGAPAAELGKCTTKRVAMLAWIVFERGVVTNVDVGGSSDRVAEQCVAKLLRGATLKGSKSRIVAVVEIKVIEIPSVTRTGSSSHDRMVSEGDSVQPRGRIAMIGSQRIDSNDDPTTLSSTEIDQVITAHLKEVRGCYQQQLAMHPNIGGKLNVHFKIAADGTVTSVTATSSTTQSEATDNCVLAMIKRFKFPAKGEANVNYPFLFTKGT